MSPDAAPTPEAPPLPSEQPVLSSERLLLRPLVEADAPAVRRFCAERELAANTLSVPHPYPEGAAEAFIARTAAEWAEGKAGVWAMVPHGTDELVGTAGLLFERAHLRAELGYWVGEPARGRGYATEASRALLGLAFGALGLSRVVAHHFSRNPASGAVLLKAGMRHEGSLRRHILKWGVLEDMEIYGVLREESA